ncbi:MAG TPA: hypothetical protein VIO94_06180 [Phenylobacterium sp.]
MDAGRTAPNLVPGLTAGTLAGTGFAVALFTAGMCLDVTGLGDGTANFLLVPLIAVFGLVIAFFCTFVIGWPLFALVRTVLPLNLFVCLALGAATGFLPAMLWLTTQMGLRDPVSQFVTGLGPWSATFPGLIGGLTMWRVVRRAGRAPATLAQTFN